MVRRIFLNICFDCMFANVYQWFAVKEFENSQKFKRLGFVLCFSSILFLMGVLLCSFSLEISFKKMMKFQMS